MHLQKDKSSLQENFIHLQEKKVLVVTKNNELLGSLKKLDDLGFKTTQGVSWDEVLRWKSESNNLIILDVPILKEMSQQDHWSLFFENSRVLILSSNLSDYEGRLLLSKGACGYAHTHLPVKSIALILDTIEMGGIWMGRSLLQRMLKEIDQRFPAIKDDEDWSKNISLREKEVAHLAAVGDSNPEIAKKLNITERTVRAHLSSVFEKLDVNDRFKLALKVHGIQG